MRACVRACVCACVCFFIFLRFLDTKALPIVQGSIRRTRCSHSFICEVSCYTSSMCPSLSAVCLCWIGWSSDSRSSYVSYPTVRHPGDWFPSQSAVCPYWVRWSSCAGDSAACSPAWRPVVKLQSQVTMQQVHLSGVHWSSYSHR